MDGGDDCHVVKLLKEYGDSILDGTFLSRIEEDMGIQVDQPLNVEHLLAQQMHLHGSVSQNDTTSTCISWPCQFCIRIVFLVVQSPLILHMIDQIKSHTLSPSNSDSNNFKEELCDDLKGPEKLPFVAPLRIKVHPQVSHPQSVSQNTNQPLTSLTSAETAQLWKSQQEPPARNMPRTPSTRSQMASDISLPEIHTNSSWPVDEEEQKTPLAWATSPELNKQLYKQDGRDSLRREAFGSSRSRLHLPMDKMFPNTRPKEWARTNSEGKFSNIYSTPPHFLYLAPSPNRYEPSALAGTPSRVRTAILANTSLAAPPKRALCFRKETSSSGLETGVELIPVLRSCEMDLTGTGFDVPAKRPVKSQDSHSTQAPSRNSLSGVKAQITLSVKKFYPINVFFLPTANATQYLDFNPYCLRAKTTAILTRKKRDTLKSQGASISAQIQSSIDDRQLDEVFASDGFTLNDLIPQPGRPVSVRDAISKVQNRKKDVLNMLNWIDYSMARVYESMGEVRKPEYDPDVMNVYLCFWAWFRLLGPALNGRRQRSWIVLFLRSKVGITRLKSYLNPNHRPISFHILLTQLRTLKPPVAEGGDFTPGCKTALDYIKRLLRGSRALNGKMITDSIITNALMWVPPKEYTGGGPVAGLQAPMTARPFTLEGVLTSRNVIPDEGVVLSSDFDEHSLLKARRIEGGDDSGFGGITDRSSFDYVVEDSDHRNSLTNEAEGLATQLENPQSLIITAFPGTRVFKSFCGPESIRKLAPDSPLTPPIFDTIVGLATPASPEYPTVYLGTSIYQEIAKENFGCSKNWVSPIAQVGDWIVPILKDGHWCALMIRWGSPKKEKRVKIDKKLVIYDSQHGQPGNQATIRGKEINKLMKKWIVHLCGGNTCIVWNSEWALGPVQDRDDNVHCGVYTLQTVCCWYGGRHPVVQLADPIKLRRAFIRRLQEAVDEKKVRMVRQATRSSNARLSDSSYHRCSSSFSATDRIS